MNKISVFLVEDDENLQSLFAELLKGDGYSVETSGDGEEALDKLMENEYDLVLLDIMLPKKDGLEILSELKNKKKFPSKVVLLTNLAENDAIAKALKFGVSGYMIKSRFTPDQFLEEVKKYLAK